MPIELHTPGTHDLHAIVQIMGEWQVEGLPMQLHPGDIGWFARFGAAATSAALRTWSRDGRVLAIGLLDGPVSCGWRWTRVPSTTTSWRWR